MRDESVEICPSFVRLRTQAAQRTTHHTQNAAGVGRRTQQPVYHSGAVVPYHDPSNRIAHTPYLSADVCTSSPRTAASPQYTRHVFPIRTDSRPDSRPIEAPSTQLECRQRLSSLHGIVYRRQVAFINEPRRKAGSKRAAAADRQMQSCSYRPTGFK